MRFFEMRIACIGWGSLIWKQEEFPVIHPWFTDGPSLPIEFTRQSSDDRVTLILDEYAEPVQVLWALMATTDLNEAIGALVKREKVYKTESIHFVTSKDENVIGVKRVILEWIKSYNMDAAIWTGLSYSSKTKNQRPTIEYIINHLKKLPVEKKLIAEEYIRKAPKQIDTKYRRQIEMSLGWKCYD